ncbi:hypothetical protein AVEN_205472-1 [Araneus ventricosus]|uniref:Uncharacterized protein n=1 Tax=Araneus ventricosus TaxID=182803 RepID=A0A4Y2CBN8_ARAVE|nr:hypothetical protein AVEN_205472-1 [Araneus ventricosus]
MIDEATRDRKKKDENDGKKEIEQDERPRIKRNGREGRNFLGGREIGPKCLEACRSRERSGLCPNIDLVPSFLGKEAPILLQRIYIFPAPTPDREIDWAKERFLRDMRHCG